MVGLHAFAAGCCAQPRASERAKQSIFGRFSLARISALPARFHLVSHNASPNNAHLGQWCSISDWTATPPGHQKNVEDEVTRLQSNPFSGPSRRKELPPQFHTILLRLLSNNSRNFVCSGSHGRFNSLWGSWQAAELGISWRVCYSGAALTRGS
jgi:hypothetical protein